MLKFRIPLVIVLLMGPIAVGCGDDGTTGPSAVLAPPPAGQGLQIKMTSTLEAGLETERCMFYRVPAEGLVRQPRRRSGTRPEATTCCCSRRRTRRFRPRPSTAGPSTRKACSTAAKTAPRATGRSRASRAGRSRAAGPPGIDGLPSDTAFKIDGNSLLLVNAHYLNASDKPLDAEMYINLYTIPPAQVTREAGIFFLYNPFISRPGADPRAWRARSAPSARTSRW